MEPQTKNKLRRVLRALSPEDIAAWLRLAEIEWEDLDEEDIDWVFDTWNEKRRWRHASKQ